MRSLKLSLLASLAAGSISSAFAGAGDVATVVQPLQSNVTYSSTGLNTYVGYTVDVGNTSGNTINNIYFTAQTSVSFGGTEKAAFVSAQGADCKPTNQDATSIKCTIGQLTAGQSAPTIALFFSSPVKDTRNTSGDPDNVNIVGTTFFAETTGGPKSIPDNSVRPWDAVGAVLLGTDNPTLVRSAVQKSGGTLFTGQGAAATSTDTWLTTVSIPASTTYTTAQIFEAISATPLASNLADQSSSELTIPGQFAQLVITLRRDASTLLGGAKIESAIVYYGSPSHPDPRIIDYTNFAVPPCTDTTYGALPQLGIPCINRRTAYTKKTAPTPEWIGDWEFEIFALDNGRYSN